MNQFLLERKDGVHSREPGGVTGVVQSIGKGKEVLALIPTDSVFQYLLCALISCGRVNQRCFVLQLYFYTGFLPPKDSAGGNTSIDARPEAARSKVRHEKP